MRKVITYGVFDTFHVGHRRLLERAAAMGDHLTVGVTTNRFDETRGKLETADSLAVRMQNVRECPFVDEVIVEDHVGQKLEDIQRLGIDVLVEGSDWTGAFDYLRPHCEVIYLPRTEGVSSSMIRRRRDGVIRLGIVGSGRIAHRMAVEALSLESVEVCGVYNPNGASAERMCSELGLGFATYDFELFLSKVDAVYVASPHETHYDVTRQALLAGRHVLCEKPMTLDAGQARELYSIARERGLVLLEAIKTAYCPGFGQVVDIVESGAIGQVANIEATFTRLVPPGSRERSAGRVSGSFLEYGSYVCLPAVRMLGVEPCGIRFESVRDEAGTDLLTKCHLDFEGALSTGTTGVAVKSEGQLVVAGTTGYVLVRAPWWKSSHIEIHREDPNDVTTYRFPFAGDGLRYELSNFAHLIFGHEDRRAGLSEGESVAIASIMQAFLEGDSNGRP